MAELDWNNNGDAIDAALSDANVYPPLPVDTTPVSTEPPSIDPISLRVTALAKRVAALDGGSE